jgi:hypothetical protein
LVADMAVGNTHVKLGENPAVALILIVVGNTVICGGICCFLPSLKAWWRG